MSYEQIINHEAARLACQAGFDGEVRHFYDESGSLQELSVPRNVNTEAGMCSAPTQSELSRWLREVKHISLEVTYNSVGKFWDCTYTCDFMDSRWLSNMEYAGSFEGALDEGLLKALKILLTI